MMGDTKDMNPEEKREIKRRSLLLLYYLLRSPFFDSYSKYEITGYLLLFLNIFISLTTWISLCCKSLWKWNHSILFHSIPSWVGAMLGLSHVTYGIKHLWSSNFVVLFNRMKILSTLRVLADNVPGLGILLSKYMSCFQPLVYHKITFIIMIVSIHFYF